MTGKVIALIRELGICAAFLLLALIFTWPLAIHLNSAIVGFGGDSVREYWRYWWVKTAVGEGGNIFQSQLLFYPDGVHINVETLPFCLIYALITPRGWELAVYNLILLFQIVFSAWGCYRLALYIWKTRFAALYAGFVMAICPFVLMKTLGHPSLANLGFLSLMMLAALKLKDGGKFNAGRALLAGLWGGLAALNSTYYMICAAIWLAGLLIYEMIERPTVRVLANYLLIYLTIAIVMLPRAIPLIRAFGQGYYGNVSTIGAWILTSIDLFGVIIPTGVHFAWGGFFQQLQLNSVEKASYLGLTTLAMAVVGWRTNRNAPWMKWLLYSTFGAWILALGPILQVAGRAAYIPLPGLIMTFLPVLNLPTSVAFWMGLVTLGTILLASGGVAGLIALGGWRRWMPAAAILFTAIEFLPIPYPMNIMHRPRMLVNLATDSAHPAMLTLPVGALDARNKVGDFDSQALWLQTLHHRPIYGGYVQRLSPECMRALNAGLLQGVIAAEDSVSPVSPISGAGRGDRNANLIRKIILEWDRKGSWMAGVVKTIVGDSKYRRVIEKALNLPKSVPAPPVMTPEAALHQADSLGIGYIMAIKAETLLSRAGLEFCRNLLPLEKVGEDDHLELYRVIYRP